MMRWLLVALLGTSFSTALAEDWSQFRGPAATGRGQGNPPIHWELKEGADKNIAWKVRIPGLGHASPIVWDNKVYVVTASSSTNANAGVETGWSGGSGESPSEDGAWSWQLICYDLSNGKQVWTSQPHQAVPRIKRHLKATHANSTPATDGKHIVTFFGSEGLFCFDMQGKLVWKKDLGKLHAGPYNARDLEWGFASSPILVDGKVVVQCDVLEGCFWASFDLKTGKELKRVKRSDVAGWATPNVYQHNGRTYLVCNGYEEMACYDLESGERIWHLEGGGDVPVPTPLVTDEKVILTNAHGKSAVFVIDRDARGNLTPKGDERPEGLLFHSYRGGNYMPTPIVVDDLIYFGNDRGILYVFDLKDFSNVYKKRISDGSTITSSPVAAGGRIYFPNEDGEVIVVQAGREFKELARNSIGEVCMTTPALSGDNLLIRGVEHLYCIRPK